MRSLVLLSFLLVLAATGGAPAASPLRYQSFAIVTVEASVAAIRVVEIPVGLPEQYEPQRSPQPTTVKVELQKVRLRILRVLHTELNRLSILPARPGDTIEVTNQYLDQPPPFAVGDKIRARLRLVLPEDKYDPADPRQQWWFFPPDDVDSISAPRQPFKGIILID